MPRWLKVHLFPITGGRYLAGAGTGRSRSRKWVSRLPAWNSSVGEDALVERQRGLDAFDDEHFEGAAHARDGFGAVAAADDELGDQRIVVGRDDGIGVGGGIHAHAGAAGHLKRGDASGRGHEGLGILGVDAALDGVAAELDRARRRRSSFSPAAMRICALIRSTLVTISVTGCSTWMRAFISMK